MTKKERKAIEETADKMWRKVAEWDKVQAQDKTGSKFADGVALGYSEAAKMLTRTLNDLEV